MTKKLPIFPSAKQLFEYLQDYVQHFRLLDQIHFDSMVLRVDPLNAQEFVELPDEYVVQQGEESFLSPEQPFDVYKVVTNQDPEYHRLSFVSLPFSPFLLSFLLLIRAQASEIPTERVIWPSLLVTPTEDTGTRSRSIDPTQKREVLQSTS